MAETDVVRDAFEEWAHADNRRLEPNECEADDRRPGNNHYYEDDTTNEAYIGWCAAYSVVAELVKALKIARYYVVGAKSKSLRYENIVNDDTRIVDAALAKHAAKP